MSSAIISEAKAELRQKLRVESKHFSAAQRAAASLGICRQLKNQPVWKTARSVLFFAPLPEEPDIHPLLCEALASGKAAMLPRYSSSAGHYEACRVCDLESEVRIGAYGIPEPAPACPIFDLKKLDLVLVPGIGFALNGFRLGRGKGFYDRLLAGIEGCKCGVAFEWQLTVEIPSEAHDVCLDCILTPTRWHDVTGWQRF